MMTISEPLRSLLAAGSVLLLAACADTVEPNELFGTYHAIELSGEQAGVAVDFLEDGGSLTLTLHPNGVLAGTLFLPGAGETGEDINAIMDGNWTIDTGTEVVSFIQAADTYVREAEWTVDGDRLESTFEFDDENFITTVLERQ